MERYILKRVALAILCVIGVITIVFLLVRISGDPVASIMPPEATPKDWEAARKTLGLDEPLYIQYGRFLLGVSRFDFGNSIKYDKPCLNIFIEKFPNTLLLGTVAMVFSIFIGIPVGILSAVKVGGRFDSFSKIFAMLGQAMPVFWAGLMLILVFAVHLRLLPVAGIGTWRHVLMPAFTLGWFFTAALLRLSRSTMLDVLDSEYIKMARIKGVPETLVILKHAWKNASIPVISLAALNFVFLINGTVITEMIFAWPGVGRLVVDSIYARDFPMIQACALISSFMYVFANLVVDLIYAYIDPRIRYQ
jgi:peptide/nickel transport system permease protein